MKMSRLSKIAFILMGIVLIEIVALMQAIFCQQVVKYNIEQEMEESSEMLLNQFRNSYEMNSHFQENLVEMSYKHFDKGLSELFSQLVMHIKATDHKGEHQVFTSDSGEYQIEIMPYTKGNVNVFLEQYGVDVNQIQDYKIISYELKQSDKLLLERRILIGVSEERKRIITIEVDLKTLQKKMGEGNAKMSALLKEAYNMSDNPGSFYVINSEGGILYRGADPNKGQNFGSVDLNTNKRIIDIIRRENDLYQHIIYEKSNEIKRSMLRVKYDPDEKLYYVYEYDQKKAFVSIENRMLKTWLFGLTLIGCTIMAMFTVRQVSKRVKEE